MRAVVLLGLFAFVQLAVATHYRGGTFYWERLGRSKIRVYWRLAFQLTSSYPEYYCQQAGDILQAETALVLDCQDCMTNQTILSPLHMECVSISREMGWSILQGHIDYHSEKDIFRMNYHTGGRCTDSSWIYLQNYEGGKCWSLLTDVDTSINNNSPRVTTGLPVYRVRQGCSRLIDLMPTDPDNDFIRCRWADPAKNECPPARGYDDKKPVCGQPTPITYLYEDKCLIQFDTDDNSGLGWYGASVMVEDFKNKKSFEAKSTVPYQFLLDVTEPGSCIGPTIDIAECTSIRVGEVFTTTLRAYLPEDSDGSVVQEVQGSWPDGFTFEYTKPPPAKVVEAVITFRSMKAGMNAFSFTAIDDNGVQNDPKVGKISVTTEEVTEPPKTLPQVEPQKSYPLMGQPLDLEAEYWWVAFDQGITRPKKKKFIYISNIMTGEIIAKYDASKENQVIFDGEKSKKIKYRPPQHLAPNTIFSVSVDDGFGEVSYNDACGRSATNPSDAGAFVFQTPKPLEPAVDCGDNEITFYIPRTYVNDISPKKLHLHDPTCVAKPLNDTFMMVRFGYDECETRILNPKKGLTRFLNTLRDDPEPAGPGLPISRHKRQFEMKVFCDIKGMDTADVFYDPDTTVTTTKHAGKGSFRTYLTLFDENMKQVPAGLSPSVFLNDTLTFSAKPVKKGMDVEIESCKATPLDRTCTKYDADYEFIKNGCPVDNTVQYTDLSASEKRFAVSAFSFLHYASNDQVMVKCKMFACKPGKSSSACKDLKDNRNLCSSTNRGRRSSEKIAADVDDVAFEAFVPLRFRH
ncbi:uncharacterized protein [Antedon mediterranea]|uniref:uncharacterized protein n=1 Tax=Antedon mediterranea TaxID=105859 RepID=UPI003AF46E03